MARRLPICLSAQKKAECACLSQASSKRPTFAEAGSPSRRTIMIRATRGPDPMIVNESMKAIPRIVWVAPALLLLIAVWRLPYGYYTFTRIVTCGASVLIAVAGMQERAVVQTLTILLLAIAVLFNPFIPFHLNRSVWFYLDLGAATAFLGHLVLVRQKST